MSPEVQNPSSAGDNKGPLILTLTWVTVSIAFVTVFLRFYARISAGPKIDLSIGVALVCHRSKQHFMYTTETLSPFSFLGSLNCHISYEHAPGLQRFWKAHVIAGLRMIP